MNIFPIADTRFQALSKEEKISRLFYLAIEHQYSVALWSLPQQKEFNLIIDLGSEIQKGKVELETTNPGFIISPFNNNQGKETNYLNADILFTAEDETIKIEPTLKGARYEKAIQLIESISKEATKNRLHTNRDFTEMEPNFQEMVAFGIQQINDGKFEKFVPSRTKEIDLDTDFNAVEKLLEIRDAYEGAFCYLLSSPAVGTWMAATPELLIEVHDQKSFKTVALAGTQKLGETTHLSEIAWTQKEIEEQAMVSRYIINSFKKIRLREFEERGPKTVKAGNLAHLKTTYQVDMEETNFPLLGSVMLDLLHPTSAVCGMPLEPSLQFLMENEGYDRQLFAGYLGPVNIDSYTNIFVNLRCMQIIGNKGILYAGAGVTDDSIPEKELQETELKFRTLLNFLG